MRSAGAAGVNRHPLWFTALVAVVAYTLSVLVRAPCIVESYGGAEVFTSMRCYSDIPPLFSTRGLADGLVPYLHNGETYRQFEYPVVTGAFAYLAASVTNALGGSSLTFYLLHIAALGFLFVLTVLLTGLTAQPRRYDALLFAISPALLLAATINWDMLTLALVAAWLLLWSRKATLLAGVALGLAISAKFYPVIFLGPLFLLCLRTANMRAYWSMCAGALGSWLVVNTPVALANPEGWAYFYTFSSDRGIDLGSVWLALSILGWAAPTSVPNVLALTLFASAFLGIAVLIWFSPTVPRLAPMLFLTLAAFLLVNKVHSPAIRDVDGATGRPRSATARAGPGTATRVTSSSPRAKASAPSPVITGLIAAAAVAVALWIVLTSWSAAAGWAPWLVRPRARRGQLSCRPA